MVSICLNVGEAVVVVAAAAAAAAHRGLHECHNPGDPVHLLLDEQ